MEGKARGAPGSSANQKYKDSLFRQMFSKDFCAAELLTEPKGDRRTDDAYRCGRNPATRA